MKNYPLLSTGSQPNAGTSLPRSTRRQFLATTVGGLVLAPLLVQAAAAPKAPWKVKVAEGDDVIYDRSHTFNMRMQLIGGGLIYQGGASAASGGKFSAQDCGTFSIAALSELENLEITLWANPPGGATAITSKLKTFAVYPSGTCAVVNGGNLLIRFRIDAQQKAATTAGGTNEITYTFKRV